MNKRDSRVSEAARRAFVNNLNRCMKAKNVKAKDIVDYFGFTASTVSDWCNGKKYPRVDAMQMLADYFGVPMSRLTSESLDNPDLILSSSEIKLIQAWRNADDRAKADALNTLLSYPIEKEGKIDASGIA